jgi:diguanylate cyclase (GGDEF)-like protein/PAS domain S-box-containing protein
MTAASKTGRQRLGIIDCDCRYRHVTPGYLELLSKQSCEVIGRTVDEVHDDPVITEAIRCAVKTCFSGHSDTCDCQGPELSPYPETSGFLFTPILSGCNTIKYVAITSVAENEQEPAEGYYRAIFESSPDAQILVDDDGIIVTHNKMAQTVFRYKHNELTGRSIECLIPEQHRAAHAQNRKSYSAYPISRPMGTGRQLSAARSDGSIFPADISLSPIRTDSRTLYACAVRDVSVFQRIMTELRQYKAAMSNLISNLPGIVYRCDFDPSWNVEFINDACELITGYSVTDFLCGNICMGDIIHEDDRDMVWRKVVEAVDSHSRYKLTYRLITKTGKTRWVWEQGSAVHDKSGAVIHLEGFITDITDRIEAENLARENELKFRLLYGNTPSIFFALSTTGIIKSVNKHGLQVLGYNHDQVLGRHISDYLVKTDTTVVHAFIDRVIRNPGEHQKQELNIITGTDDILHGRCTAKLSRDSTDSPILLVACEDITEQKRLSDMLSYQACHDSLTGLINRAELLRRLENVIERARSDNSEHVLCFLDLDQFKIVNDTCGHLAGDELLRQLGEIMKSRLRSNDTIARIGGDEFVLLLENCPLANSETLIEEIRSSIRTFRFTWHGRFFSLGVSIGVTAIDHDSRDAISTLGRADTACYAAKESGRDKVIIYRKSSNYFAKRQGDMEWVSRINMALEEQRFYLVRQPIAALLDDSLERKRYEILIRMLDDEGNTISPGNFLYAAERYDLSVKIDKWVIRQTLEWLSIHGHCPDYIEQYSINLSAQSLCDKAMLSSIIDLIDTYSINCKQLCFEITETNAIRNLPEALSFIKTLGGLGCQFALDDFGSGFSSFAYLRNLPVDYLKIDGGFVKNILNNEIDLAMVKSINDLGHVMGKKTIAEFVTNREILGLLMDIGVDYAQGEAVGMPERMLHIN